MSAQKRRKTSWTDAKSLVKEKSGRGSRTSKAKGFPNTVDSVLGITGTGAASSNAEVARFSDALIAELADAGQDAREHGNLKLHAFGTSYGKFLYGDIPLACNGFCPVSAARPMGLVRAADRSLGLVFYAGQHFGVSSMNRGHDFVANPDA
jgi:hypothetical protein